MHKIGQSGRLLGRALGPLLKTGLLLMKNVLKPLAKRFNSIRISSSISNKCNSFGSGMTTLIISIEEMNDIMKIIKSLEESSLLIKGVSETIKY